jgi:hypothetical protein
MNLSTEEGGGKAIPYGYTYHSLRSTNNGKLIQGKRDPAACFRHPADHSEKQCYTFSL